MNKRNRILIVDDNPINRELLVSIVESLGHNTAVAGSGEEALEKISPAFDLVMMDVMMPGIDGYETVRRLRADPRVADLPIIMVTALGDKDSRLMAVEAGANDFIAKPVDITEVRVRTASLLKMKEAQDALKHYLETLEEAVEQRTAEVRRALANLEAEQEHTREAHCDTIVRLSTAAEYKDEDTADHILRMSRYTALLAEGIGLPAEEVELLRHASPMHDVGKIGVPDHILLKPGKLTAEEWEIMKTHTTIGARILGDSPSELLQAGRVIALSHHEKWAGGGYPAGVAGNEIPLWGRLCAVADVFDALTSRRPYKPAFSNKRAYTILREGQSSHFDPQVVEVFFDRLEDVLAIQQQYQD